MRWNEDVTMKFVKAYLKHQHLWDTRHPLHKHKFRRNKSLQSVLDEFRFLTGINIDSKEAKLKIKSLRSTYKQEINKILNRSMPEAPYTPSIKWFDEWHRCFKNLPTSRLRSSEIESTQEEWLEDSNDEAQYEIEGTYLSADESQFNTFAVKSEFEADTIQNDTDDDDNKEEQEYQFTNKRMRYSSPALVYPESTVKHRGSRTAVQDDEFEIYGKYIASQLRKMDVQKALRLQLEIQSLVSEARIADMTEN